MKQILFFSFFTFSIFQCVAQRNPRGLELNATAPDFTAKDQDGKAVNLHQLTKKGPVVVVFYRGNWCPYCSAELKKLQDSLVFLTDKGASVVAISPEASEGVDKTVKKAGATFPVLHDEDVQIANAYDVSYEVDEKTRTVYLEHHVDFLKINEQTDKAVLPVPAVYIVNKEGKIIYRFFKRDITKRPSVKDLLDQL
jgi:peroxiredoxin